MCVHPERNEDNSFQIISNILCIYEICPSKYDRLSISVQPLTSPPLPPTGPPEEYMFI